MGTLDRVARAGEMVKERWGAEWGERGCRDMVSAGTLSRGLTAGHTLPLLEAGYSLLQP